MKEEKEAEKKKGEIQFNRGRFKVQQKAGLLAEEEAFPELGEDTPPSGKKGKKGTKKEEELKATPSPEVKKPAQAVNRFGGLEEDSSKVERSSKPSKPIFERNTGPPPKPVEEEPPKRDRPPVLFERRPVEPKPEEKAE